jgi:hypothetical protein
LTRFRCILRAAAATDSDGNADTTGADMTSRAARPRAFARSRRWRGVTNTLGAFTSDTFISRSASDTMPSTWSVESTTGTALTR